MSTQVQPRRREVVEPNPPSFSRPEQVRSNGQKALTESANDHFFGTPRKYQRVDPLWMITAAGAMLFVFLAVAVALG